MTQKMDVMAKTLYRRCGSDCWNLSYQVKSQNTLSSLLNWQKRNLINSQLLHVVKLYHMPFFPLCPPLFQRKSLKSFFLGESLMTKEILAKIKGNRHSVQCNFLFSNLSFSFSASCLTCCVITVQFFQNQLTATEYYMVLQTNDLTSLIKLR